MHPEAMHFMQFAKDTFPDNFKGKCGTPGVPNGRGTPGVPRSLQLRDFVARDCVPHRPCVLDVGSGDINGNNRMLFEHCDYTGNDVIAAPNVTIVSKTKDLPFENHFDTIVSTECFEHDPEYALSFAKIYMMLKPGGLFAFTCASTGRPEHGTRRTSPRDSYGTIAGLADMSDYYKNLTVHDLNAVLPLDSCFSAWAAYYNASTCDLYFVGVKRSPIRPYSP